MQKLFGSWTKKIPRTESLAKWNNVFKNFMMNYSWYVYLFAALVLIICFTFNYGADYQRKLEMKRRRQLELERANRQPQQRRPGAAHRNHEIFRNAVDSVREYIVADNGDGIRNRPYRIARSDSGTMYMQMARGKASREYIQDRRLNMPQ